MTSGKVDLRVDQATPEQTHEHLLQCDPLFVPNLSSYVDLAQYATRLHANAIRFEAWADDRLIGLLAIYANRAEKAFISNLSVEKGFQGLGVASQLMDRALEQVFQLGLKMVELEVDERNKTAVGFYSKHGFIGLNSSSQRLTMHKDLDQ